MGQRLFEKMAGPVRGLRAVLALATVLPLAVLWLVLPRRSAHRRRLAVFAWRVILRGFGVRLEVHGAPVADGTALIAANHVSWLDIVLLGRLIDGGLIAKAEVAGWPVIGALARRYGCLFVRRESRIAAQSMAACMDAYPAGQGLILFPEGTTGDGMNLLPFRSSLFAGGARWLRVQPVAIVYCARGGAALTPQARRRVAWLDEDSLLPHALRLAAAGGVEAHVWFEPPVAASCRKAAAETVRRVIARRLEAEGQAAALKRAA